MHKKLIVMLCLLLMTVFMVSAAVTTAMAKPPGGCNTCAKAGCPAGHCYVDCEGCCFLRLGVVYCYR